MACGRTELVAFGDIVGPGPAEDPGPSDDSTDGPGASEEDSVSSGDPPPTVECIDGGEIQWQRQLDTGDVGRSEAFTVDAAGQLAVAGATVIGEERSITVLGYAGSTADLGDAQWSAEFPIDNGSSLRGGSPRATAVTRDGDWVLAVGYGYSQGEQAFYGLFTPAGDLLLERWTEGIWLGVAPIGDGTHALVGHISSRPGGWVLERADIDGGTLWRVQSPQSPSLDRFFEGVAVHADTIYVSGRSEDAAWIGAYTLDGEPLWDTQIAVTTDPTITGSWARTITVDDSGVYVVGNLRTKKDYPGGSYEYNEAFVAAFTLQGRRRWLWNRDIQQLIRGDLTGLAIHPDGDILVAGQEGEKDDQDGLFAARFAPTGELRWELSLDRFAGDQNLYDLRATDVIVHDGRILVLANDFSGDTQQVSLLELCD